MEVFFSWLLEDTDRTAHGGEEKPFGRQRRVRPPGPHPASAWPPTALERSPELASFRRQTFANLRLRTVRLGITIVGASRGETQCSIL